MNNEERVNSLEPEDTPSTCTGSKLETTKLADASPENTNPAAPIATENPQAVEVIEQPVDEYGPPSSSVEAMPRTDEVVPSIAVEPIFVKKPQSFFGEQPLPIIEMAPRVLRYRTRRDLLLFSASAVAAAAGAGFLLPQTTLSRMGVRRDMNSRGKEWLLNKALRIDDDVAEALYLQNRMMPTYTKSQITPIKNNYNGATPWVYIGVESDSEWACFWLKRLIRHSKAHESLPCTRANYPAGLRRRLECDRLVGWSEIR